MSVSLQKGQKVSLTKDNSTLKEVMIGLGWDQIKKSGFSLFAGKQADIDCDASALLLQGGKLQKKEDIVYFGNLRHISRAVQHMGDNLTGAGNGDDEQIIVDLSLVPENYDKIVLVVTIYQCTQRHQHFGMIQNAYIRIVDKKTNQEMCKYSLTDSYNNMTALIFGEVYRHGAEWKFNAVGDGTNDPGLGELVRKYQ